MIRSTQRWWRRPLQTLEECRARYGDMFTYRIAHEGTWVFLSDPEAIKQVFTGDPRLLHAGEATPSCCRCSASTRSCCSTSRRTWSSAS